MPPHGQASWLVQVSSRGAMFSPSCPQHRVCFHESLQTVLWGTVLLYFAVFVVTSNSLRPYFFLVIPAIHNYQSH